MGGPGAGMACAALSPRSALNGCFTSAAHFTARRPERALCVSVLVALALCSGALLLRIDTGYDSVWVPQTTQSAMDKRLTFGRELGGSLLFLEGLLARQELLHLLVGLALRCFEFQLRESQICFDVNSLHLCLGHLLEHSDTSFHELL